MEKTRDEDVCEIYNEFETDDDIRQVKFESVCVDQHRVNLNIEYAEKIDLISEFSDIVPYYTEDKGMHLTITGADGKKKTFYLPNRVASNLLMKGAKDMSNEEYYQNFITKRKITVDNMLKCIYSQGFEHPSVVQKISLAAIIEGRDTIVQFKSGGGKTLAFLVGSLWNFDYYDSALQYVFLSSAREIAGQIYEWIQKILFPTENSGLPTPKIALCVGKKVDASSFISKDDSDKERVNEMNSFKNAQIIVGTIGRFYDILTTRKTQVAVMDRGVRRIEYIPLISLKYLKTICIDEFDIMVSTDAHMSNNGNMTQEKQIDHVITQFVPPNAQRLFFSATVSNKALDLTYNYLRKEDELASLAKRGYEKPGPFICLLDMDDYTLQGIKQYYVIAYDDNEKLSILQDLLNKIKITQVIIFVNSKGKANALKEYLNPPQTQYRNESHGDRRGRRIDESRISYPTEVFHADLTSKERENIRDKLIRNEIRILISTDVLSRGFDASTITLVINYDMPTKLNTYIHRIGRTGRYGRKGVSITLLLAPTTGRGARHYDETKWIEAINEASEKCPITELPADLSVLQV